MATLPLSTTPRALPRWLPFVLTLAALLAIAWWRIGGLGFVWDDDDYVTENPVLRDATPWRIWFEPRSLPQYYPLVHTTFWLEYHLWGLSPLGYHLVNVALHAVAAWSFWRLLLRLAVPGAMFAALWFAVHPMHVESVAWVTERKNVLSLALALAAAHGWLTWHDERRRGAYLLASLAFVGALLAKTVVATVPPALAVLLWWRDGRVAGRAWRGLAPWLLVGATLGWVTAHLEATLVGGSGTPWQLVGSERIEVAGRAVWFYAARIVWPFGTCFNYPRWQLGTSPFAAWGPALGVLATLALAWSLRSRLGRGPLAVALLFVGMLTPALGFFDVFPFRYSFVADHFAYHASLAALAGIAALGARWARPVTRGLAAVVLTVSVWLTQSLAGEYRDFATLFEVTLARNPRSALALANLGTLANQRGDAANAKDLLDRCLQVDPSNHEAMVNLGALAHRAGDRPAARAWYDRALALKPDDIHARNNLAVWLIEGGDAAAALPLAQGAVATAPDFVSGHATLAWALCELRRWRDALPELDFVLRRQPADYATRRRAVACLWALGEDRQAAGNALLWFRQQPNDGEARREAGRGLARVLAAGPAANTARDAAVICEKAGVDLSALRDELVAALDAAGATAHAAALRP